MTVRNKSINHIIKYAPCTFTCINEHCIKLSDFGFGDSSREDYGKFNTQDLGTPLLMVHAHKTYLPLSFSQLHLKEQFEKKM